MKLSERLKIPEFKSTHANYFSFYSIFEDFHFNHAWKTGICMLRGASRGKSVQLCVDAGRNQRVNQRSSSECTWEYKCLNRQATLIPSNSSPRTCTVQLCHLNLTRVQSRLQAQRSRIPGEHPWAQKPWFCFHLPGGTSQIPHFLKLQNGVNELISVGLMFASTSTDEKCDMRAVGNCYYQGATYLH